MEIEAPVSQFVFHHGNAYEENGKLTVDSVALDSFDFEANMDNVKASYFFNPGPMGRLHRTQIDLKTGKIAQSLVSERGCEFPSIPIKKTGVKHKYIYTACSAVSGRAGWGPNRAVMKSNLEDGSEELFVFGAKKFTGEPIFAPKTNANREDDGYLLVVVYDAEKNSSSLAIMDARNIEKGPVAEIKLPARLPYGLHGSWVQP